MNAELIAVILAVAVVLYVAVTRLAPVEWFGRLRADATTRLGKLFDK